MAGTKTHEQRQRIINKQEKTKGVDTPVNETIEEARRRHQGPPAAYDNSTGDRSIKRGANQETEHHKERADD
jgi:hypothetical protein